MKWVVQTEVFYENEDKLVQILGDRLVWCKYKLNGLELSQPIPDEERFVFYGSTQLGRQLFRQNRAINWLYDEVYDCTYYMHKFGADCLNNPHILTEVGNFHSLREMILGETKFFVKQNFGYKSFTGRVFDDYTQDDIDKLFDEELLLLAEAKSIGAEWRFVIKTNQLADEVSKVHQVVTWSPYGDKFSNGVGLAEYVKSVLSTAKVRSYDPAPFWVLDVCEYENSYKVVEVNSLLSSGWYDCDVPKIIEEVDKWISENSN